MVSVGSLFDPHVKTSFAVVLVALLILESTNLKSAGDEQVLPVTAGKLTLSQMSDGRYGFPDATRLWVTFVDRSAYTVTYVCSGAVYPVCDPVVPLKAMAGMPSFEASVAAPTVPDTRTVLPRFAEGENVNRNVLAGQTRLLTPHVEPRHRNIWRTSKEFWRQRLDAVAHGCDWIRVHIIQACVGCIVALGRRSSRTRVILARFCEWRCWRV